jgi:TRAP-type C4-dicarboxylate transport system permease small subunit
VSPPDPPQGAADRPLGRRGARLYDGLGLLGGVVLGAMTLAVFVQVVFRFLGRAGFDGLDEIPRYLFVWLVMIGAAAAMHRGEHTALDFFVQKLAPRRRALVTVVTHAAGLALFLSMLKSSLVLVPNAQLQTSAGLGLPLGYVYAAVPVGATLIMIPLAWRLGAALRALWQKPS